MIRESIKDTGPFVSLFRMLIILTLSISIFAAYHQHDCNPNTEFHRLGSQMVFRAIRPILIGSEITTFYGENYFEWGNSECLCQTCEDRGSGAWGRLEDFPLPPDQRPLVAAAQAESSSNGNSSTSNSNDNSSQGQAETSSEDPRGSLRRRSSARRSTTNSKLGSPQTSESSTPSTSRNNGDAQSSDPAEPQDASKTPGIPNCKCVTCGALFDPPETWWTPDECGRCERHYKIFKADWPSREPTEKMESSRRGKGVKGKGKAKAADSESEEDVKVKGKGKGKGRNSGSGSGKMNGRLSTGSVKAGKAQNSLDSSSNGLSSTDEFSESSTPIKLSPLRNLHGPSSYQQPKTKVKKPRKSNQSQEGDKSIGNLDGTTPKNSKFSNLLSLEDSGSDLTEDEDEDVVVGPSRLGSKAEKRKLLDHPSSSNADDDDAATVSSSDSSLTGPKMLGKEATVGTLALFWGAPEGDTRSRRPAANAPVQIGAARVKTRKNSSHQRSESGNFENLRRSASAGSALSTAPPGGGKKEVPVARDEETGSVDLKAPTSGGSSKTKKPTRKSPEKEKTPVSASRTNGSSERRLSDASTLKKAVVKSEDVESNPQEATDPSSPSSDSPPPIPGLATQGTARTSLGNLALAWSAGSDSRRSRKQATREPFTLAGASSEERDLDTNPTHPAKKARKSAGAVLAASSRSETPEVLSKSASSVSNSLPQSSMPNTLKRPRGRPPQKIRVSLEGEEAVLKGNNKSSQPRHSTGNQVESLMGANSQRRRSPLAGPSKLSGSRTNPQSSFSASLNDRDHKKPKLETTAGPSFGWPVSGGSNLLQNPISLNPNANLTRHSSSNSQSSIGDGATASPPAATSPLVGPRPASGAPKRKNLRWGRGKVSESRVLGDEERGSSVSPEKRAPAPASTNHSKGSIGSHGRSHSSSSLGFQLTSGGDGFDPNGNASIFPPAQTLAVNSMMADATSTTDLPSSSNAPNPISQIQADVPSLTSNGDSSTSTLPPPELPPVSIPQADFYAGSTPSFYLQQPAPSLPVLPSNSIADSNQPGGSNLIGGLQSSPFTSESQAFPASSQIAPVPFNFDNIASSKAGWANEGNKDSMDIDMRNGQLGDTEIPPSQILQHASNEDSQQV